MYLSVIIALDLIFMELHIQYAACARMCVPEFCRQLLQHHQASYYATGYNPSGLNAPSAPGGQMVYLKESI